MKWIHRRYRLWIINTSEEAFLYKWENWKLLMPSIDKLFKLTKEKSFIRTFQSFQFENKWLGFGRMIWDEENNLKWTTKYRTAENESRLQFFDTEIWAPDWNNFAKTGMPPDVYVKLYHNDGSETFKEGLIIAIPRRLSIKHAEIINNELERMKAIIPNSTVSMTTRFWTPWFRFYNNIEDMNLHEMEKIMNDKRR